MSFSCSLSQAMQSWNFLLSYAWFLTRSALTFLMVLTIEAQRLRSRAALSSESSAMVFLRFERIARAWLACVSTTFLCGAARPGVTAVKSIGHAPKYGVAGLLLRADADRGHAEVSPSRR